jgi:L-threonylcarbamoyladenylate synthase
MILPDNQDTRKTAAEIITNGGVIAFRTDTFYGLGADPLAADAVAKIRQLKGREESKAILLLVADASAVNRFVSTRTRLFDLLAARYWPGPLTLVAPARPELPAELTAGSETIGVRLPDDARVRELVRACGGALTATSANRSGGAAARNAEEVSIYFPSGLDLIVDGGEVVATAPSSVVDVSSEVPRLIREGAISARELLTDS